MQAYKLYIVESEAKLREIDRKMKILNDRNEMSYKKLEILIKKADRIVKSEQKHYLKPDE